MKAVKNDLNFFKAYKLGPGKHAEGGFKGVLALIGLFILVVAIGFAVPFTLKLKMQKETSDIQDYLATPEVIEKQAELSVSSNKNNLLMAYLGAINKAKENFGQSIIFDSELFNTLSASMPSDVVVGSLSISTQNMQLSCTSTDPLAPAKFKQELEEKGIFSHIAYGGISQSGEGSYSFSMTCTFGELPEEETEDTE